MSEEKNKKEPQINESQNKEIVEIDGVEYNVKDLSEEQVKFCNMVADCNRKIGSMQFNLEQITLGRDAWMMKLRKSLDDMKVVEEVVAE